MVAPVANAAPATSVPVIDLSPFLVDDERANQEAKAATGEALNRAAKDVGFFYIKGFSLASMEQADLADVLEACGEFFGLPPETKHSVDANKNNLHRGYVNSRLTGSATCDPTQGRPDNKESFMIGAQGSASVMHGDNQWPATTGDGAALRSDWQATVQGHFDRMLAVAHLVQRALALSLQLDEQYFVRACQDPIAQMLLLNYPPASPDAVGCGSHTDCGFLTLLAQDDVGGLQVRRSDQWIDVPPLPGCLVVNLGDMVERWTNGVYVSTEHRVLASQEKNRHSVVFFCNCDFDARVESIPSCVDDAAGCPAKYPPITAGEYIMQKLGLMYK